MDKYDTISMCETCYRHIPARIKYKQNQVFLEKQCPVHGYHEDLVEIDKEFYNNQEFDNRQPSSYWLDITNRCNLDCPHCYQMPNNASLDPTIEMLLEQVKKWPDDGLPVSLVGAEPTTRNDLPEIIDNIKNTFSKDRTILIVTNGINLRKNKYASKFREIPNLKWTIGLNHPKYNGERIRQKQEQGIENAIKYGLEIKTLTYTLEHIEDVDFVMNEMQQWRDKGVCNNARVQLGVEIGKTPEDEHEYFLSELVTYVLEKCRKERRSFKFRPDISSRTHYAIDIEGITYRLIKWCDVKTINFNETQSESWAQLIPHKPMSNLLHQVILRDRFINQGLPLFDTVPTEYTHKDVPYLELSEYFIVDND